MSMCRWVPRSAGGGVRAGRGGRAAAAGAGPTHRLCFIAMPCVERLRTGAAQVRSKCWRGTLYPKTCSALNKCYSLLFRCRVAAFLCLSPRYSTALTALCSLCLPCRRWPTDHHAHQTFVFVFGPSSPTEWPESPRVAVQCHRMFADGGVLIAEHCRPPRTPEGAAAARRRRRAAAGRRAGSTTHRPARPPPRTWRWWVMAPCSCNPYAESLLQL